MSANPEAPSSFGPNESRIYREGLGKPRDTVRQALVHDAINEHLPEGQLRVLDIGCGSGPQALWSALDGHEVVGLEPDAGMRQLFEARLQALEAEAPGIGSRVSLIEGVGKDAPSLFGDGSFDAIYLHGVLGYLEPDDQLDLLDAIRKVVKPGGIVSMLNVNGGMAPAVQMALRQEWEGAHKGLLSEDNYIERQGVGIRTFTPEDHEVLFIAAGFTEVQTYGVRTLTDRFIDEPLTGDFADIHEVEKIVGSSALRAMSAFVHIICQPNPEYIAAPEFVVA